MHERIGMPYRFRGEIAGLCNPGGRDALTISWARASALTHLTAWVRASRPLPLLQLAVNHGRAEEEGLSSTPIRARARMGLKCPVFRSAAAHKAPVLRSLTPRRPTAGLGPRDGGRGRRRAFGSEQRLEWAGGADGRGAR